MIPFVFFRFRVRSLKEEIKTKTTALTDVQQQLKCSDQDRATLTMNLDKINQEQTKLNSKLQNLMADLQKAQQEKEAHKKEIGSLQENLANSKKALKESQNALDAERKTHKSAVEERVCLRSWCQFNVILQLWNNTKRGCNKVNT